ncbi:MAG TPA: hypothetical protein VNZ52_07510, partial [Candidatus Thermoplasmatota archaeon]|nr:hypothetical protein [Candidatus Thermoplasmatota archaeon]
MTRMHARSALLLAVPLLLAIAIAAPALAQVPLPAGQNPCGALTVRAGQTEGAFTPGERIDFTVAVRIAQGNGLDADVRLTPQLPSGWRADPPNLSFAAVTTQEQSATFSVTAPGDLAANAPPQTLTITSVYSCNANLPQTRQPVQQNVPGPQTSITLKARA